MLGLKKICVRKRAVSPVVAAILLIGLTVAAGAIVYFVVLPMLAGGTTADDVDTGITQEWATTTGNSSNVKVNIKNGGEDKITIDSATLGNSTHSASSVTFSDDVIEAGKSVIVTFTINGTVDQWTTAEAVTLTITFHVGDDTGDTFSVDVTLRSED